MKRSTLFLGLAAFVSFVPAVFAQTTVTVSGTCAKADVQQSLPAGDSDGHIYGIAQGKCTAHVETAGVTSEGSTFSEHREITPTAYKGWGTYVENYANGDKVVYSFSITLPIKNGALQPGSGTNRATFGTGKLKGIKASGKCAYSPHPDNSVDYKCEKIYQLPASAK